jgi:hypothetical protein
MRNRVRWSQVVISFVFAGTMPLLAAPASAQTAVTTCGQTVRGDAYLAGDLNCAPDLEAAVEIQNGRLDLRGFTISGGEYGILCARELEEPTASGEHNYRYLNCSVANGTIAGQSEEAVVARGVTVSDVTIDTAGIGILARKRMRFSNLTLQLGPNAVGFLGLGTATVVGGNLTSTGGLSVLTFVKKLKIDGFTASGYVHDAVYGAKAEVMHAALAGGERGIAASKVRVEASSITGHSAAGIDAGQLKITGSTVTANTLDLKSAKRPKVATTICDTSNGWGVCAND